MNCLNVQLPVIDVLKVTKVLDIPSLVQEGLPCPLIGVLQVTEGLDIPSLVQEGLPCPDK